jgi:hypothetical protein
LSCGGACAGAAAAGWVGALIAGFGATGLGLAAVLRGLGSTGGGGGGAGTGWSIATTGLGTKVGGGLENSVLSGCRTLS